jgi:hypothetical protein
MLCQQLHIAKPSKTYKLRIAPNGTSIFTPWGLCGKITTISGATLAVHPVGNSIAKAPTSNDQELQVREKERANSLSFERVYSSYQ